MLRSQLRFSIDDGVELDKFHIVVVSKVQTSPCHINAT